jgi:hypothetical protein
MMMKNSFFTMLLLLSNLVATAQFDYERAWGTYFGGNGTGFFVDSKLDSEDNVYLLSYVLVKESLEYYNAFATAGAHQPALLPYVDTGTKPQGVGHLSKFSPQGELLWSTYLYTVVASPISSGLNSISKMIIDTNNNIYIYGRTINSQLYTTAATGIITIPPASGLNTNFFVAKFNSDGQELWGKYLPILDSFNFIIDDKENMYVRGTTNIANLATPGAFDSSVFSSSRTTYIAKYDPQGNTLWFTYYKNFGGAGSFPRHMDLDADGNLYLLGAAARDNGQIPLNYFASLGAFQNQDNCDLSYNYYCLVLSKFSPIGERLWSTYYGMPQQGGLTGTSNIGGIAVTQDSVYITGYTSLTNGIASEGSAQPQKAGPTYTYTGPTDDPDLYLYDCYDGFVAKFNLDGQRQWATYIGGEKNDYLYDIVANEIGVFVLGATESQSGIATEGAFKTNHSPVYITQNTEDNEQNRNDIYITKFTPDGEKKWGTYYGGDRSELPSNIILTNDNVFYLEGITTSNAEIATPNSYQPNRNVGILGYDEAAGQLSSQKATRNQFLVRFSPTDLGANNFNVTNTSVFPNPTQGRVQLTGKDIQEITVVDLQGKILFSQKIPITDVFNLDLSSYENGVYLAKTKDNRGVVSNAKIIKK